jgi:hypothetical protein
MEICEQCTHSGFQSHVSESLMSFQSFSVFISEIGMDSAPVD